ncbi:MAG: trypsin-like peptidase domain-containing protein [Saprospirales bacterium]|nr:trypsin-like peptidase domain-containing protein [Saprospirales bacterium]
MKTSSILFVDLLPVELIALFLWTGLADMPLHSFGYPDAHPSHGAQLATVKIITMAKDAGARFEIKGSGILIRPEGLILTNEHNIRKAVSITVTLFSGRIYPAKVVRICRQTDLALLRINAGETPWLPISRRQRAPQIGDDVFAIGSARGLDFTSPTVLSVGLTAS